MHANFTEETCTGTGATMALAGATTGNIAFQETYADGEDVPYVIEDSGGTILVAGIGTYVSATDDITRNDMWNWNGTAVDDNPSTNITLSGGTHTIRCATFSKTVKGNYQDGVISASHHFIADNVVLHDRTDAAPGNEFGATAGRISINTQTFTRPVVITSLGVDINTASSGNNIRCALYFAEPDGGIGALIADSGNISTTSTGLQFATLSSPVVLPAGDYFSAVMADNTTVTCSGTNWSGSNHWGCRQGADASNTAGEVNRLYDVTYGAFPSTLGTEDATSTLGSIAVLYR